MRFFNKIVAKLSGDTPQTEKKTEATDASETPSKSNITNNAIDMRDRAVKAILNTLKPAIGSSADHLSRMQIWVIVPTEDFNPIDFPWADDVFKSDLRLALDNSMLAGVGKRSLEVCFATIDKLPAGATPVFTGELFYSWGKAESSAVTQKEKDSANTDTAEAWMSIIEGTGSLTAASPVHLSAKVKKSYKIGRGVSTRKYGKLRINDIVICDSESNPLLAESNNYVSSAQAEIIIQNNTFYIKASEGGCRNFGGVATKVYREDNCTELLDTDTLIPLRNNDMIELGKRVALIFTTKQPE